MPTLSILTGNIGCGKSFIASKLAQLGNTVVSMDRLYPMFEGGHSGSYDPQKKPIYHATENAAIESALDTGLSVVIDRTNIDRKTRQRFIELGKKYAAHIVSYNWGPGTVDDLERRCRNARGIPLAKWHDVFTRMLAAYECPRVDEGFDEIIEPPKRFRFHAFDFDGTLVENRSPEIGEIIQGTVDKLNALFEDLSNVIILWTCRSGDLESQMKDFLAKTKIRYDFINENPIWDPGSRKIFSHYYYDDRNVAIRGM